MKTTTTIKGNVWVQQSPAHWICWIGFRVAHSVFLRKDSWRLFRKLTMMTKKTYGPYPTMREAAEQVPEGEQAEILQAQGPRLIDLESGEFLDAIE